MILLLLSIVKRLNYPFIAYDEDLKKIAKKYNIKILELLILFYICDKILNIWYSNYTIFIKFWYNEYLNFEYIKRVI
jgi:hypothetical protein